MTEQQPSPALLAQLARAQLRNVVLSLATLALLDLFIALSFFRTNERTGFGAFQIVTLALGLIATSAVFVWRVARQRLWQSLILAANLLFLVIFGFAFAYYAIGGASEWTAPLTHLDALYVALGTLSTAGTGSIAPVGQGSRGLVSLQMFVDIVVMVLAVGVLVSRLSAPSGAPKP
jgi:hypothetical protein